MNNPKPTLHDIANEASVSLSTLTRYLHQRGFVSREKQQRIQKAINNLGYQPRLSANRAKAKSSYLIGVLIPYALCPHSSAILSGLESGLAQHQFTPIVMIGNWNNEQEQLRIAQLKAQGIDALVVIGGSLTPAQLKDAALERPVVTIGCTDIDHPNIHCIKNSSLVGGYMATNHLLRLGHTNIVYLSGIHFHPDSKYRRLGYQQALEKAGLTYDPERVISGHFNVESGRKAVEKLLAQKLPFTAIFAANDQMAFGAIQALENAGVRVPQHVSVIGFDDHEVSSAFTPALTTIRQPSIQFGRSAAIHLAHILGVIVEESETRCDEDSVRVVIRHSCSPCRQ